jgi:hypothetical protein
MTALVIREMPTGPDWAQWQALGDALASGHLYSLETEVPYVYSPLAAPMLAALPAMGIWLFAALHVGAVLLLRHRLLIILSLTSWAFWADVSVGNTFTFAFIAAALALRGSRTAGIVFFALLALFPRPLEFPLALWLLWKEPRLRWPAVAVLGANALAVFASGYMTDWFSAAVSYAGSTEYDIGPTKWLGHWSLVVGLPLGAWLLWSGRVGWAGLAMSTYVVPQYLMLPLLDLHESRSELLAMRSLADPGRVVARMASAGPVISRAARWTRRRRPMLS